MKTITNRLVSHFVMGADIYWVPDGTAIEDGNNGLTTDINNMPGWEKVAGTQESPNSGIGKCLGVVKSWRFNPTYKELEVKGSHSSWGQRYQKRVYRSLESIKPTFTVDQITPEAFALFFGVETVPAQGESVQPFSNASGTLSGWLYIRVFDSFRTTGHDGELAQIILHGDLGLADSDELTEDIATLSLELTVDKYPENGFTNTAINTALPNE